MKKRTKIAFAITSAFVGIVALLFYLQVLTPYGSLTANIDLWRNKPAILGYGGNPLPEKEGNIIAKQLGFRYKLIGLYIPATVEHGAAAYNAVIEDYLAKKLGAKWKKSFKAKVDSLAWSNKADTIRKIIMADPDFKEKDRYYDLLSKGKSHLVVEVFKEPTNGSNVWVELHYDGGKMMAVLNYYYVDPFTLKIEDILY